MTMKCKLVINRHATLVLRNLNKKFRIISGFYYFQFVILLDLSFFFDQGAILTFGWRGLNFPFLESPTLNPGDKFDSPEGEIESLDF